MKKIYSVLAICGLVLFSVGSLSAQKNIKIDGRITLKSNDTIEGTIEEFVEGKIKDKIYYKEKGGEESFVLIKDIESLIYEDGLRYQSIDIDGETIFVKKMIEGAVDLVHHIDSKSERYFIINEDRTIVYSKQSKNKENKSLEVIEKINAEDKQNPSFRACKKEVKSPTKMKGLVLKDYVTNLNNCLPSEVKRYPTRRIVHQLALIVGPSFLDLKGYGKPLSLGFIYNRTFSNFSRKTSVLLKGHYLYISGEKSNIVCVPLVAGLSQKFLLGPVQPYAYFGVGVSAVREFDKEEQEAVIDILPTLDLGAGIDIPINAQLSIKTEMSLASLLAYSIGLVYNIRTTK